MRQPLAAGLICLSLGCGSPSPAPATRADPAPAPPAAHKPPEQPTDPPGAATDSSAVERTGVIGRNGTTQTLLGPDIGVGAPAPAFDLVDADGKPARSVDFSGKVVVLSIVPSIETPVCEAQTGRMAALESELPPGTVLLTVSRDEPAIQKQFLSDNQFETRMISDAADGAFGRAFGLGVKETGLLARSVFVIGKDGKIVYRELVAEQTNEPDYDKMLAALEGLGSATP